MASTSTPPVDLQDKMDEVRGQFRARVREEVGRRSDELGSRADSIAKALSLGAEQLERNDEQGAARAAEQAADRVERIGQYLQRSSADMLIDDAESFARRRPWLVCGVGAAVGFVAARFLKASSEGRYSTRQQARLDTDAPLSRELETGGEVPATPESAASS
jgi:ElaB/YqjD/DUF883 family membrane-anchored ribosome-binding protein